MPAYFVDEIMSESISLKHVKMNLSYWGLLTRKEVAQNWSKSVSTDGTAEMHAYAYIYIHMYTYDFFPGFVFTFFIAYTDLTLYF